MKAETFVKIGVGLAFVTALLFWQEVWGWVDGKESMEIAQEIIGFALKWFYLALLAFLAASVPHYIKPWLRAFRRRGQAQYKRTKRNNRTAQQAPRQRAPNLKLADRLALMVLQREGGNIRLERDDR